MRLGRATLDLEAVRSGGGADVLRAWMELGGEALSCGQGPPLPPAWVAEGAVAEPGAVLGDGTRVWRFSHVRSGAVVGEGCNMGQGVYIDAGAVVGSRCKLQNGVNLYRGVMLGDGVFVGPSATFTNDRYPRAEAEWEATPTLVGQGASVGAHATIVCGSHLGAFAMVAAGAVVTRPVPPHGLVAGVPARLIGYVCTCGRRAGTGGDGHWRCGHCGATVEVAP